VTQSTVCTFCIELQRLATRPSPSSAWSLCITLRLCCTIMPLRTTPTYIRRTSPAIPPLRTIPAVSRRSSPHKKLNVERPGHTFILVREGCSSQTQVPAFALTLLISSGTCPHQAVECHWTLGIITFHEVIVVSCVAISPSDTGELVGPACPQRTDMSIHTGLR
jgi:hypothetical protein